MTAKAAQQQMTWLAMSTRPDLRGVAAGALRVAAALARPRTRRPDACGGGGCRGSVTPRGRSRRRVGTAAQRRDNNCQTREEDAASVYEYTGAPLANSQGTGGEAREEDAASVCECTVTL